jgi:hypothetical protein
MTKSSSFKKSKKPVLSKLLRLALPEDLGKAHFKGVKAITVGELLNCKVPKRPNILGGFLRKGGRCMIAGPAGVGKTHLGLGMATHLSMGKPLLGWDVDRKWKVAYLDGEMAPAQVVARLKRWARRLPGLAESANFRLAPFTAVRARAIDMTTKAGRRVLLASIGADTEVVVIDNYSSFNPGGREDAEAWAPVDAFLNKLSSKGIATVLIHHAGKGRAASYRGTSKLIGPVDTFISLSRLNGAAATGKAQFAMRFEKTRDRATGDVTARRVKLVCSKDHGYKFVTEPLDTPANREADIKQLIDAGYSDAKAAEKLGVDRSTVNRHRKKRGK